MGGDYGVDGWVVMMVLVGRWVVMMVLMGGW